MDEIHLSPIGVVHSSRNVVEDDDWDSVTAWIEIDSARFSPDALAGLDTFSHVEVVYWMNRVESAKIETGARHPRNNQDWPRVGIFAQRAKNRPNRIGTTICRVQAVEGFTVRVAGLDAVDGTPVLDLKPWVREFGPRGEIQQPPWMDALMAGYWRR
jgi:tRNA-Thr(GGU) m(6)t(6)A37 methyltransferase TsaA